MRLINADAIKIPYKRDDIYYRNTYSSGVTAMVHAIGKTPTIEAEPVVHGRWIFGVANHCEYMKCSECLKSQTPTGVFAYRPNCGAKMDQEE